MNTRPSPSPIRRRGRGYGVTWREKRPRPLTPEQEQALDAERVPASYRNLITRGLVHYVDCGWNSGGCEKLPPLSFGTVKSPLWSVLNAGHQEVALSRDEMARVKTWIDLNCPLWPDYIERQSRPLGLDQPSHATRPGETDPA